MAKIENKDHVKEVCKIGKGEACCAYLVVGPKGFECAKGTTLVYTIEHRLAMGAMNAKGDNCLGITAEFLMRVIEVQEAEDG